MELRRMELLFPRVPEEEELLQDTPNNAASKADVVSPEAIQLTRDLPALHGAVTAPGTPPPTGSGALMSAEVLAGSDVLASAGPDDFPKQGDARVTGRCRVRAHVGPSTFMLGSTSQGESPSNETEALGSCDAESDMPSVGKELKNGDEEFHGLLHRGAQLDRGL
jgi:hypothetical protein